MDGVADGAVCAGAGCAEGAGAVIGLGRPGAGACSDGAAPQTPPECVSAGVAHVATEADDVTAAAPLTTSAAAAAEAAAAMAEATTVVSEPMARTANEREGGGGSSDPGAAGASVERASRIASGTPPEGKPATKRRRKSTGIRELQSILKDSVAMPPPMSSRSRRPSGSSDGLLRSPQSPASKCGEAARATPSVSPEKQATLRQSGKDVSPTKQGTSQRAARVPRQPAPPQRTRRAEMAEEAKKLRAEREEQRRLDAEAYAQERRRQRELRFEAACAKEREWIHGMRECPTFYPTEEEFKDPMAYICKIREEGQKYGIAKVVPPYVSTIAGADVLRRKGFTFTTKVMPLKMSRGAGKDRVLFKHSEREYSVDEYEELANQFMVQRYGSAGALPARQVEYEYWKEMLKDGAGGLLIEYGSDIEGTAFADATSGEQLAASSWNLATLPTLPGSLLSAIYGTIPGVTVPMMYMGMLFSTFAWHVEDHNLYSVNYHHIGAPKVWYGVPASAADDFEHVVRTKVYTDLNRSRQDGCLGEMSGDELNEIHGKTTMFSPRLLVEAGVPCYRAVQQPGEYMFTFPRGYHGGFSTGFNCGEAVNFAMADWLGLGMDSVRRYRKMQRLPLFPHEEVVVHEAIQVDQVWQAEDRARAQGEADAHAKDTNDGGSADATPCGDQHQPMDANAGEQPVAEVPPKVAYSHDEAVHVAASFVAILRNSNALRASAVASGAQHSPLPELAVSAPCSRCKHLCYLGIVVAEKIDDPICLWCDRAAQNEDIGTRCVLFRPETARFEAIAKRLEKRPDVATSLKSLAHTWRVSEAGALGDINAPANGDSSGSDAPFEWATIPNTPQ